MATRRLPLRQHRKSQIRHAHPISDVEPMGLMIRIQIAPKANDFIAKPLSSEAF
jgi:hypothetical protein